MNARGVLLAVLTLVPARAVAQVEGYVGGEITHTRATLGSGITRQGPAAGLLAGAGRGIRLELHYAQGTLRDASGGATLPVVDGAALLAVHVVPWVYVAAGPHVVALGAAPTERWVLWEGRAGVTAQLSPGVRSYLEGRDALAAAVNLAGSPESRGLEVGLRVSRGIVAARLRYGVTHLRVPSGPSRTLETIGVSLAVGRR